MTDQIATLSVDLSALAANYRFLKNRHHKKAIAAVVKANAYGLGVGPVSKTLWQEGCREFFVATLDEGIELRAILPEAFIGVFQGFLPEEEPEFVRHRLTPVLNDLGQVERFRKWPVDRGQRSVILHIDTGMTRLGLTESDWKSFNWPLATEHQPLIMSHLACANNPDDPKNAEQLRRFHTALKHFPGGRASLANSSGLFLSSEFHFDLGRPGCALYGITPVTGQNPMKHVATLSAPIIQIRTLDRDETVGYGATYAAKKGTRIAIVAFGYADGYLRYLSNKGAAYVLGRKVPIAGRVSMDMIALDISSLPEEKLSEGMRAELINAAHDVNAVAQAASTIGYEIFTRIGTRVKRLYTAL